jgi:hypothetical protein
LLDRVTQDPAAWIEPEKCNPMLKPCADIGVHQFQHANANHDQASRLQQLEDRDKSNESVLSVIHS